jgi:hypothetical protein
MLNKISYHNKIMKDEMNRKCSVHSSFLSEQTSPVRHRSKCENNIKVDLRQMGSSYNNIFTETLHCIILVGYVPANIKVIVNNN